MLDRENPDYREKEPEPAKLSREKVVGSWLIWLLDVVLR